MREDKGEKIKMSQEDRRFKNKTNKTWFDAECKKKRAEYRKAKGMHKNHANYYSKGEREHVRIKSIKKL